MTESILSAVRVVLFEPQDAINIGATLRAMKNMGVATLRLVRPAPYEPNRLVIVAHDTHDLVERIEHYDTLDAALADCVYVAAFTARRRAAKWTVLTPATAAAALLDAAGEGPVALLFGREDSGLPNDALDRAHAAVTIPTTAHPSLNLAQAVMIALYELHVRAGDATRRLGRHRKHAAPPTAEHLERLFADAEASLAAIEFFKTRNPELIMRTVRSLVFRAAPDARETELLRAMAIEVRRSLARAGNREQGTGNGEQ